MHLQHPRTQEQDYDSDHNALEIIISPEDENSAFVLPKSDSLPSYNYKATNWKNFNKSIIKKLRNYSTIPNDRNLNNSEIDCHLVRLNRIISNSIQEVVPRHRKDNRKSSLVTNRTIDKLHSEKNKLLTIIKRHNRLENMRPTSEIKILKAKLKLIRKLINENTTIEFNKRTEKTW